MRVYIYNKMYTVYTHTLHIILILLKMYSVFNLKECVKGDKTTLKNRLIRFFILGLIPLRSRCPRVCFVTMTASHPNNNHPEDIRNVFVIKRTLSTTALTKPPDCALNSSPQPAVFRSENKKNYSWLEREKKKKSRLLA